MRKPKLIARPYKHDPVFKWIIDLRPFGKGRKFFKHKSEADAEAMRQRTTLARHGQEALDMPRGELSAIIDAKNRLAKYSKTISDAATFLINHLDKTLRHGVTVSNLAAELLEAKRKDGMSKVYLKSLRFRLKAFCNEFGDRPIAGITVEELDNWLRALPGSPKSRANYRINVSVLFGFAEQRGIVDQNPVLRTAKPKMVDKAPEIFTVDELRALLEAARKVEPSVLPMLAIGAFAGLREAEIQRLDWNEVDLARLHIEVTAAKAKSARRRIVPIQPNLAAWLRPYSGLKGLVAPKAQRKKLRHARQEAGLVRWPSNGLRHSFASYRLAATNNAALTAAELGHTNAQLLYSAYRELVRPEDAQRYWLIRPPTEEGVVAFQSEV